MQMQSDESGAISMNNTGMFVVNYNNYLRSFVRESLESAAVRWQCDFLEVNERVYPIEQRRPPASVKLDAYHIFPAYDRLFFIDTDTLIRSDAPSPFDEFGDHKAQYIALNWQPHHPPGIWGHEYSLELQAAHAVTSSTHVHKMLSTTYFNYGVCMTHRSHQSMLDRAKQIYFDYQGFRWYDQTPLNIALHESEITWKAMHWEWNFIRPVEPHWPKMVAYIYHFTGGIPNRYEVMKSVPWRINDNS